MRITDDKSHALPGSIPGIRYIMDYETCESIQELETVMDTINRCQYQPISVTQDSKDVFRVFFRRCAVG